jgi:hypothetical protein
MRDALSLPCTFSETVDIPGPLELAFFYAPSVRAACVSAAGCRRPTVASVMRKRRKVPGPPRCREGFPRGLLLNRARREGRGGLRAALGL